MSTLFKRKFALVAYSEPTTLDAPPGGTSAPGPGLGLGMSPATVQSTPGTGIDLSNMQVQFKITSGDTPTPTNLIARVINLSDTTAHRVQREFSKIVLQAGYENGPYGMTFNGTIKEVRKGRLDASTTFLDVFAGDWDLVLNFATVNTTLAAGSSPLDRAKQLAVAAAQYGATFNSDQITQFGGVLPRGRVMFGMFSDQMRTLAKSINNTWFIENGIVKTFPQTGYLPGEVVVLTAKTGLIGVPEATQDGVNIRCLLNPLIKVGQRIQIDNKGLNQTTVRERGYPNYSSINYFANESADGIYRVLVVDHTGDTRGDDWYSDLICLAIDPSAPIDSSVPSGAS